MKKTAVCSDRMNCPYRISLIQNGVEAMVNEQKINETARRLLKDALHAIENAEFDSDLQKIHSYRGMCEELVKILEGKC